MTPRRPHWTERGKPRAGAQRGATWLGFAVSLVVGVVFAAIAYAIDVWLTDFPPPVGLILLCALVVPIKYLVANAGRGPYIGDD